MVNPIDKISESVVSVILHVYNAEKYLSDSIQSILNQTYKDFELIIVDDCSTDASMNIVNSFNDNRIKIIKKQTNTGISDSLKLRIQIAKGKYIARMDADDICLPERFDLQVKQFEVNPNAMIVGSDYYLLEGEKNTYIKNINDSDYQKAVLLLTPCFCHPTVMMKNVFKEKQVFYDKEFIHAEDYKLWTDLYAFGEYLKINKPLLKYRHHASQISNQKNELQLSISRRIRENYLEKLKFKLSEKQFDVLNVLGNNTFVTSVDLLKNIENCLLHLELQNSIHNSFNTQSFNRFLFKFWLDSCGNTNLGMNAYRFFFKSKIASYSNLSFADKNIFLLKCLIRKFKR